jgi:hypothetical protein
VSIDIASRIRAAVDQDMNHSARAQQSAARLIGPSEVGGCRAYLAHMIAGTPYDDDYDDIKWAAYVGTYLGAAIETGLARHPDTHTQVPITATYPSGLQVSGSCDLVIDGDGVYDLKSKNSLAMVRKYPPSLANLIQVNTYLLGAIQQGLVPADGTWNLVYIDRSGADDQPHVVSGQLDMDLILIAESRLEDALYAAEHNLDDAPRDQPMDWCLKACPFVSSCRGKDEHQVEGLITNDEHLTAVNAYRDGLALEKQGKALKDEAKATLLGVQGSTGEFEISWTWVDETTMPATTRSGYNRMTLRKVPTKKLPKKVTA